MNTYEAMILLDNREVKKGWDRLKETVDAALTKNGAEIVVAKRWDERKLAYEIRKQRRATYYLAYFKAEPGVIGGIRRSLRLSNPVLRSLIQRREEIPADAYEPEKEFKVEQEEREEQPEAADGEEGQPEAADGEEGQPKAAARAPAAEQAAEAENKTENGTETPTEAEGSVEPGAGENGPETER